MFPRCRTKTGLHFREKHEGGKRAITSESKAGWDSLLDEREGRAGQFEPQRRREKVAKDLREAAVVKLTEFLDKAR